MEASIRELAARKYTTSGRHGLDPVKVARYLEQIIDEDYRKLVAYILAQTVYITMDELIEMTRRLVGKALTELEGRDFYILLPTKVGSEWWFTAQCYDLYRDHPLFRGFISPLSYVESGVILIIDDAIYSGFNLIQIFDDFCNPFRENPIDMKRLSFRIITPITTTTGPFNIEDTGTGKEMKELRFYSERSFTPLMHLIPNSGYDDDFLEIPENSYTSTLPEELQGSFRKYFFNAKKIDFMHIYASVPLIFDHKVANEYGSFPEIYLEGLEGTLLMMPPDRTMLA